MRSSDRTALLYRRYARIIRIERILESSSLELFFELLSSRIVKDCIYRLEYRLR